MGGKREGNGMRDGAGGRTEQAGDAAPEGVSRFVAYFKVRHYEMDALGHVNNAVYLHYLEQAAIEHTAAVGFTFERLREIGGLFIARRHEIDYLRPATAGDVLQVVTWPVEMKGAVAIRDYEIYRQERRTGATGDPAGDAVPADRLLPPGYAPAGELVVRARTQWVWVDTAQGRPRRMPTGMRDAFLAAAGRSG